MPVGNRLNYRVTVSAMRRVFDHRVPISSCRGFTLVEMIIVIVMTGVVVGMVAVFGKSQVDAYFEVSDRAALSDAADTALRRIGRELQAALPNSVRVDTSKHFLEFVPVVSGGRYRAILKSDGTGDPLDLDGIDTSFEIFGPAMTISAADFVDKPWLVINNLGLPGADVYDASATSTGNRRALQTGNGLSTLNLAVGSTGFTLGSPAARFQIVNTPVTYECDLGTGVIRRRAAYQSAGKYFIAAQPTDFSALGGGSAVLVEGVTDCQFDYFQNSVNNSNAMMRRGLVVMHLVLTRNGESVGLDHLVEVMNNP